MHYTQQQTSSTNTDLTDNDLPESIQVLDESIKPLSELGQTIEFPRNKIVFHRGDFCESYFLVLAGSVKVMLTAASGREIVLYHVGEGESCVLTTSCILAEDCYPAEGITETDVTALVFDKATFSRAMHNSEQFRKFVFSDLGKRFSSVISRIEQVSFSGVDSRLAEALLTQSGETKVVATHQMLATDIGSAREVVSRQLKQFESNGLVKLGRGSIQIIKPDALQKIMSKR